MIGTLLFDFGMLVCIWSVQLTIYPSFLYYSEDDLKKWHSVYTSSVFWIVGPLMFGQLAFHSYGLLEQTSLLKWIGIFMVIVSWFLTFGWAVKLHGKIDSEKDPFVPARKLVNMNWYRVITWSLTFLLTLLDWLIG